jgi:hypothetical protein
VAACLYAPARLRVAHQVNARRGVEEVAAISQVHPLTLRRMVRSLGSHRLFEPPHGRVVPTGKGRLLRWDCPVWSDLYLSRANDADWHLDHPQSGEATFPRGYRAGLWTFLASHLDPEEAFTGVIRLRAARFAVACTPLIDPSGATTIAGIRGGTSDLLAAVLKANPNPHSIRPGTIGAPAVIDWFQPKEAVALRASV